MTEVRGFRNQNNVPLDRLIEDAKGSNQARSQDFLKGGPNPFFFVMLQRTFSYDFQYRYFRS